MMRDEILFLAEETPDGRYSASAIGYQIVAEGKSMEDLRENILRAVVGYFRGKEIPCYIRLNIIREEILSVC